MYKLINKTIVIFIIAIMIWVMHMQLATVNAVNGLDEVTQEADTFLKDTDKILEYEWEHMKSHNNAYLQDKYTRYMLYGYILVNAILVVTFSFIVKKNTSRRIINIYLILLTLAMLVYFIGIKFIRYSYPSIFSIINTDLYMIIFLSFISVLLGVFVKGNRARIIFSTIPIIAFSLIFLISEFYSFEYLLDDLSTVLSYVVIVELCTQILLIPSYIKYKR